MGSFLSQMTGVVRRVQAVLDEDLLTSGNAAKPPGALSFATDVTLARFGRWFFVNRCAVCHQVGRIKWVSKRNSFRHNVRGVTKVSTRE